MKTLFCSLLIALASLSASATPRYLNVPYVVPWCGGNAVSTYAETFDGSVITGHIVAKAYCSTGGRGTHPKWQTITYVALWDATGKVLQVSADDGATPYVGGAPLGATDSISSYRSVTITRSYIN